MPIFNLKEILNINPSAADNSQLLRALLMDLYPDYKKRNEILVILLKDGIVTDIRQNTILSNIRYNGLCTTIESKYGYSHQMVANCIAIWAETFDIQIENNIFVAKASEVKIDKNSNKVHEHIYKTYIVSPTCNEKGYTLHKCNCGCEYKDTYTSLPHSFILSESVDANCESAGHKTYKCRNCNLTRKEKSAALGHNWSKWVIQTHSACGVIGMAVRQCYRCGKIENKAVNTKGHNFTEWVRKDGYYTRECKDCDLIEKQAVEGNNKLLSREKSGKDTGKKLIFWVLLLIWFISFLFPCKEGLVIGICGYIVWFIFTIVWRNKHIISITLYLPLVLEPVNLFIMLLYDSGNADITGLICSAIIQAIGFIVEFMILL